MNRVDHHRGEYQWLADHLGGALSHYSDAQRIAIVPPDITRLHSMSGLVTKMVYDLLGSRISKVLPATGTHRGMTDDEMSLMYSGIPRELFVERDWRSTVSTPDEIDGNTVSALTSGLLTSPFPIEIDRSLVDGSVDLIVSIGQVVPHEVAGMSGQAKNLFVGTGGPDAIHRSHLLSALYGIENTLGRIDTPVRKIFDHALGRVKSEIPPVLFLNSVVVPKDGGESEIVGMYSGGGRDSFVSAARHAQRANVFRVPAPVQRCVVFMDPTTYQSTWLANKAIYRTRMAIADGGELFIIAPGVDRFGEDELIDAHIRRYGYSSTQGVLDALVSDSSLANNQSAAAHLIHGSTDGRFSVVYGAGRLDPKEVEAVGYLASDLASLERRFGSLRGRSGIQIFEGVPTLVINDPGLGLWIPEGVDLQGPFQRRSHGRQ